MDFETAEFSNDTQETQTRIPNSVIWATIAICVGPFLLNLLGVNFGSNSPPLDPSALSAMPRHRAVDTIHTLLSGSFTHTILEWSAFCTAIFTVILAFVHFGIKRDQTTPIIGMALFCAGIMDAFHTLAADRLIQTVADTRNFIPFTWAISRLFNALIMVIGAGIFLIGRSEKKRKWKGGIGFVVLISLAFGAIAFVIIDVVAGRPELPRTMFPASLVTRPYDVAPLFLFIFAGIFVFRPFHRRAPSLFSHAILISVIPQTATQAYMAFGSVALFDNYFNIAHFLKIFAYFVPFIGLALDYVRTYREEALSRERLEKAQSSLIERTHEVEQANRVLETEVVERQHAEETLRQRESQLSAILETAADGIITFDEGGAIHSFNAAAARIFGYASSEVIGENVRILMPTPDAGEHDGYLHRYMTTGESRLIGAGRDVAGLRRGGTIFPVHLSVSEVREGDQRMFTGIVRDITEIKRAEEALKRQTEELARSNQELDDFAYIASHDLKEPLRGIHNYATFLLEDYADKLDEDGRAKLETLPRLTQRLEKIIDSLLYFSRLGRADMSIEKTDLNEVLDDVIASLDIGLQERGIELRVPRPLPSMTCDRVRVAEVFRNLITNAMKYNEKPEKWIEIGHRENERAPENGGRPPSVFYVRDNGIGIREKHLDSVFRIFKRLHGREAFGGGTGAGLTITKKIVERHGGQIWAESTYGEGTTFFFTLKEESNR